MPEQQSGQGVTRDQAAESLPAEAEQPAANAGGRQKAERCVADPSSEPVVERRVSDAAPRPAKERRRTGKSLLLRRLTDPTAKERRRADVADNTVPSIEPAKKPTLAVANVQAVEIEAEAWPDPRQSWSGPKGPWVEPAQRRMQVRGPKTALRDSSVWASKRTAGLIGLNVLTAIAVLALWRVHSVQLQAMRRATAASSEAAYAACLGSQTLRNELLRMWLQTSAPAQPGATKRDAVRGAHGAREKSAQLLLDVDKTASIGPHLPVLFHLDVQNLGKSPARNAKVWGAVMIVDSAKEPDFRHGETTFTKGAIPAGKASQVVLYTASHGHVAPLNDAALERINSGAAYVVAYGRVVYEDIFGVKHWAKFCRLVTEPIGGQSHSGRCAAYNSSGVSERREGATLPSEVAQSGKSVALEVPDVACQAPHDVKD